MQQNIKQKEYWDGVSGKKEFTTPFHAGEFSDYVTKDSHILDVGCGYGRTLDELYHNGYRRLTGIDFSSGMIERVLKPGGILYVNDFLLNTNERNLSRHRKFQETFGVYGVFELPEGAVCRHHDERRIKQLLKDFTEQKYGHLTFTTMNGHTSNGFYFIGTRNEK